MKHLDFILKMKAYEVFVLILVGAILKKIEFDTSLLSAIFAAIGILLYASWPILVGHALYQRYPTLIRWNYQAFSLCSGIWLLAVLVVPILSAISGLPNIEIMTVPGAIVVFLAVGFCLMFTAKLIESAENRKEVDGWESLGVLLLILVLPIGIWFLQPMLNKAVTGKLQEQGT